MARRAAARRAMTLLEMAVVVFIVGLLGLAAATRYGGATVAEVSAHGFARRLALDCLQARRRAISTGDNHSLRFSFAGGQATQYALHRNQAGVDMVVDETRTIPTDVTVTTGGATDIEYTFTGETIASRAITVAGPDRSWRVSIPQVTGKAFVDEL
ncbi:MAG: type II secretion system GspH family protein [Planctomycetes bacterium]|nr:type II secretion system GspH family protein [Planctomycetota bacterium]